MAENITYNSTGTKAEKYRSLYPQVEGLIGGESDHIANLANLMACLKEAFHFFWVGAYLVKNNGLVLGPFQGPVACTRIPKGKGVCGTAFEQNKTLVVADVDAFPGHIACSALSKSEIVVCGRNALGEVTWILDIDSDQKNAFDDVDAHWLQKLVDLISVNP